jgi:hypothetical protein
MWWQEIVFALQLLWDKVVEIVQQPMINKEMLWILIPILAALFLIEFYFARYKGEELGWHAAVNNSLCLFFVGMDLCSFLVAKNMLLGFGTAIPAGIALQKSVIAYFIIFEAGLLILLNFFHLPSKEFAFGVSSNLIVNFLGVIATIIVYSSIAIDWIMLPAVLLIFLMLVVFLAIVRHISPESYEGE